MAEGNKGARLNEVLAEEFSKLHNCILPADSSLATTYEAIHRLRDEGRPRSALCLSGGGIRSASFALGVLHGFAERGLLDRFTYLSTVSGGGYIGGWLSNWRRLRGDAEVTSELEQRNLRRNPAEPADQANEDYRESPEVSGLRASSNYLTPKLGVMSADTWALAALYIRNLLLNWLIYLPVFLGVLLAPWLAFDCLEWARTDADEQDHWWLFVIAIAPLLFALVASIRGRLGKDRRLLKWTMTEGNYIRFVLLPAYFAAMFFSAYAAGPNHPDCFRWWVAAVAGGLIYATAWFLAHPSLVDGKGNPIALEDKAHLFLSWMAAGAIAGALIGFGCQAAQAAIGQFGSYTGLRLLVVFGVGWVAVSLFLADAVYLGLTSYWKRSDDDREWLARSSGWLVAMTLGWAGLSAAALYGGDLARWLNNHIVDDISSWTAGAASVSLGAAVARIGKSAMTAFDGAKQVVAKVAIGSLLALGSLIILLSLAIILASWLPPLLDWFGELSLVAWTAHQIVLAAAYLGVALGRRVPTEVMAIVLCFAVAYRISLWVNVNRFSAHALYRNRLGRAFLGSARGDDARPTRDPFTGFDAHDNPRVKDLPVDGHLFHVVNTALNVVGGSNTAWQERKAESFVITPLHSGNEYVGFVPTKDFASDDGGITLGTSIAISGAAANPNQGYHSSPLIGFIMTLFNVRLGWWLGNPRNPEIAKREGPKLGIWQVISELFGSTNDESKYVYLSDGGHFENLGLYEMVRRRCHLIVVSDGGCDPDCAFEDLGNAVRKIWIDLGVSIDFRKIDIRKRGFTEKNLYCALGTVTYPECNPDDKAAQGHILYIKPGFHNDGREPADVTAYALANVAFPHETTADQFFSESQMESYRSLGAYIIKTILGEAQKRDKSAPTKALRPYWAHLKSYASATAPEPDLKVKVVS